MDTERLTLKPDDHDNHGEDSLSAFLMRLRPGPDGRISLRQLAESLEDRSFGAFLVVFSLPNLIPMPPGATLILGLPLILIAWQMMVSHNKSVWLPDRLANVSAEGERCMRALERIMPWLQWIESAVRPRFWFLKSRRSERVLGLFVFVLAILVFLPIPFGNWLPALALATIGLSVTERDGYGILLGALVGVLAIFVATLVIFAAGALLAIIF